MLINRFTFFILSFAFNEKKRRKKPKTNSNWLKRCWIKRNLIAYDHIRILLRTEFNNTLNSRHRLQNETFSIFSFFFFWFLFKSCVWMVLICACAMYRWSLTKNNEHMMLNVYIYTKICSSKNEEKYCFRVRQIK